MSGDRSARIYGTITIFCKGNNNFPSLLTKETGKMGAFYGHKRIFLWKGEGEGGVIRGGGCINL